jgi:hypothetical protein
MIESKDQAPSRLNNRCSVGPTRPKLVGAPNRSRCGAGEGRVRQFRCAFCGSVTSGLRRFGRRAATDDPRASLRGCGGMALGSFDPMVRSEGASAISGLGTIEALIVVGWSGWASARIAAAGPLALRRRLIASTHHSRPREQEGRHRQSDRVHRETGARGRGRSIALGRGRPIALRHWQMPGAIKIGDATIAVRILCIDSPRKKGKDGDR